MANTSQRGAGSKKSTSGQAGTQSAGSRRRQGQGGGSYGAKDITVLEGLEAVRKRPGMYIGSTGPRGLHHLVYEVVDNSVDEAIAGHCQDRSRSLSIRTTACTVADDGRGIPVDRMKKERKPAAEVVLTTLHAGGKFGDGGGYKVSGRPARRRRLGRSTRSPSSSTSRSGATARVWTQTYERGKPRRQVQEGPGA